MCVCIYTHILYHFKIIFWMSLIINSFSDFLIHNKAFFHIEFVQLDFPLVKYIVLNST